MNVNLYLRFCAILFIVSWTLASAGSDSLNPENYFDVHREFPNYFLPEQFRSMSPQQLRAHSTEILPHVQRMRVLLEQTTKSIFDRLTVPIMESSRPRIVRYFPYMQQELRKIDVTVRILPSGGVTRSVWGYIYAHLHQEMLRDPSQTPEQILERIAHQTVDLPSIEVRGVGSDWDVLLMADSEKLEALKERALKVTNSAESELNFTSVQGVVKRTLFTVGDVKEYRSQTTRSTNQGGSTVDFLAFDYDAGAYVEPEGYNNIVNDLIQGIYSYVAPHGQTNVEDSAKQTIRGLRAFLEIPYVVLEHPEQLRNEMRSLAQDAKDISYKAFDQFAKMVRNARFSGAHNRFYRGAPGSIEELALQLSQSITKERKITTIPEFVDTFDIEHRTKERAELKDLPRNLLTSVDEFKRDFTADGLLYHGTRSPENGLAIMRQGLFLSRGGQGLAVFGRGGYATPSEEVARGYAGVDGLIFKLKLKNSKNINILVWPKVKNSPFIKSLLKRHNGNLDKTFEDLARNYGIDIITNTHVLIQNTDVLQFPKTLGSVIESFADLVRRPTAHVSEKVNSLLRLEGLYAYGIALGEKVGSFSALLNEVAPSIIQKIKNARKNSPERALAIHLARLLPDNEDLKKIANEQISKWTSEYVQSWKEQIDLAAGKPPRLSVSRRLAALFVRRSTKIHAPSFPIKQVDGFDFTDINENQAKSLSEFLVLDSTHENLTNSLTIQQNTVAFILTKFASTKTQALRFIEERISKANFNFFPTYDGDVSQEVLVEIGNARLAGHSLGPKLYKSVVKRGFEALDTKLLEAWAPHSFEELMDIVSLLEQEPAWIEISPELKSRYYAFLKENPRYEERIISEIQTGNLIKEKTLLLLDLLAHQPRYSENLRSFLDQKIQMYNEKYYGPESKPHAIEYAKDSKIAQTYSMAALLNNPDNLIARKILFDTLNGGPANIVHSPYQEAGILRIHMATSRDPTLRIVGALALIEGAHNQHGQHGVGMIERRARGYEILESLALESSYYPKENALPVIGSAMRFLAKGTVYTQVLLAILVARAPLPHNLSKEDWEIQSYHETAWELLKEFSKSKYDQDISNVSEVQTPGVLDRLKIIVQKMITVRCIKDNIDNSFR